MITKTLKWVAIALLLVALFWQPFHDFTLFLQFVVSAAAAVALVQAFRMRRYVWMALFLLVFGVFNPVFAVVLQGAIFRVASVLSLVLFFLSVRLLQPKPRLTIPSITDRLPGSQSL